MSTWRRRFTRKSQKLNENDGNVLTTSTKYRKKLQTAIVQINRTKKTVQRNLDNPDSDIHIARLINEIGQLSECKPLQDVGSLVDSLAMRRQLSSRIFNEYSMNALEQSLQKLNDHLSADFDKARLVYEEASANHCSEVSKRQLLNKVQCEWSTHQKLAMKEVKRGLSSYCDIGLYNLKIQMTMLEKLQELMERLPHDDNDATSGTSDIVEETVQTRKDIDTMLRIMLDAAPNDPASLPNVKRPRIFNNQITLPNTLYSPEIPEASVARSQEQNTNPIQQYPSMIPTASVQTPDLQRSNTPNLDSLPSYNDLFVVPATCKEVRPQ